MKKSQLIAALNEIPGDPVVSNTSDADLVHVELSEGDTEDGIVDVVLLTFEDE